ncbi:carbohydrate ABC transporter membrane protein 1 (CUT1 family) [Saccharopolyspora erythraea NRRL 2338]|uniref:Sugar ABC transporter permease n=1 Tax=Saccharopolyspora erythraea TaxID=1836 RepID=A0ABN1CTF7_SACER|nr:sugar ABC transporter permease [Saccharopolyspora erythraea]PFG98039.1 carbohydrate ABC transporter membrane protein 1 (CUT1 family) [Saccharopolyspora erythraea NRRL 2338]
MRRTKGTRVAVAGLVGPFLLLFLAFFIAPVLYTLHRSLLVVQRSGPLGLGGADNVFGGLTNYRWALEDPGFIAGFGRILLFGVVQVPVMILGATVLALLLDTASARWKGFFRSAYFLPYGVPGVIASILWGFLYTPGISPVSELFAALGIPVDFLSSGSILWSIANIVTWTYAGYNMLVIIAQLNAIDPALQEAARIDGANAWQIAIRIKLPLIRPALVLNTVFSIIGTLQLFTEPLLLKPLSGYIDVEYTPNMSAYAEAFTNNDYGLAAAQSIIVAVTCFVLSFGFLKLVGRRGA